MADELDPTAFAASFIRLMSDVHRVAGDEGPTELEVALAEHLGVNPSALPVVEQVLPLPDHPNVQLALEEVAAGVEGWRLFGLPVEVTHWTGFGLANLASPSPHSERHRPVAPAYVNVPVGVDETLPCVSLGVWLLAHEGRPVVVLFSLGDPHRHGMGSNCKLEVMAAERETGLAFLAHLRTRVHALNVYRGKVLSFTFGEWGGFGLEFHALPDVGRNDLILPEEDLAAIERHTLGVARHAERLRDAKRHLKRGLLLYGPPGTGKTFSIMYLCSQMPGRTAILLSGQAAPTLGQAAAMARSLQPSMLVLEDVDLVAMERTHPGMPSNPLLFQLLNEMDGLDEDADVLFVLTTNRVELLEPALSARPGRIDQAVEIRLPDDAMPRPSARAPRKRPRHRRPRRRRGRAPHRRGQRLVPEGARASSGARRRRGDARRRRPRRAPRPRHRRRRRPARAQHAGAAPLARRRTRLPRRPPLPRRLPKARRHVRGVRDGPDVP